MCPGLPTTYNTAGTSCVSQLGNFHGKKGFNAVNFSPNTKRKPNQQQSLCNLYLLCRHTTIFFLCGIGMNLFLCGIGMNSNFHSKIIAIYFKIIISYNVKILVHLRSVFKKENKIPYTLLLR